MNKFLLLITCCLPLRYLALTSPYGYRLHPITGHVRFHSGIDLRARRDTVFAVMPGQINDVHYDPALGVYIILDSGDLKVMFGHLSQVFVQHGDSIAAGTPIAITGSSGRVTGEHLHFSVSYRKKHLNPLLFLNALMNNLN
ncbi:M23 family metallopeptidase [Mucilaginibacter sp. 5B2]|nr:M23 family metallopeptidase [Mucilaginibacter sp. 5B2]